MHIVVNTRLLLSGKLDGIGWFSHEVLSRITKDLPQVDFTFLFDRPFDDRFIYHDKINGKALFPPCRHPLLYRYYFEQVIPRQLDRLKADLFFSPDGFLSTKTDVKQIPVIHDLNFEHRPLDLPPAYRKYYRKYFPRFAKKADQIITVSEFSRQDIHQTYGINLNNIHVAHNGRNPAFQPLSEAQRTTFKERLTHGKPYFIFVGNFSYRKNLHTVIRAFDNFKKQEAEAQLLLVGNPLWKYPEMESALEKSPFKDDILFPGRLESDELVAAMGAAEGLLFPSYFEGFGIPVVEALASGIPVITSNQTALPEVGGDACFYTDPEDYQKISSLMMKFYRDDNQRIESQKMRIDQAHRFSWDQTANKVKSVLLDTLK